MGNAKLSVFLCFLLRHSPETLGLGMDKHGWVDAGELIAAVNRQGKYRISRELLDCIVAEDEKGRYRYSADGRRIKACQGHSIPWVEPELEWKEPPARLFHGTTASAYSKIMSSGGISKMGRHAVHLQAVEERSWQSARRWHTQAVVLVVDAAKMAADGYRFGVSDNAVWCTETVPTRYIVEVLYEPTSNEAEYDCTE